MRRLIILAAILVAVLFILSAVANYLPQALKNPEAPSQEKVKIVTEESIVIDAVKKVGPSVVTVVEVSSSSRQFSFGPFSIFESPAQPQSQNIGSGFMVSKDGFIVTNKHVVGDSGVSYQIITAADKKYDVQKIYRDPLNDIAILKIDPSQNPPQKLKPVEMGDSSKLVVGQFAIAIGTALGEFRNTVTTGVISGLGRGITAGSEFEGYVERLDNVIQTSAAINPGNSGGPLLNSSSQVIGINTAIARGGQNIGFALPINVVKDSLKNFNESGQFNRPYLGIAYKIIDRDVALLNNVPEGAFVQEVIAGSSAEKAGIEKGDIIIKIDGKRIEGKTDVAGIISRKKVEDSINITVWRNGKTIDTKAALKPAPSR
ncbi:MAG: hypothetical protein A3B44_00280 [Candidatus Levybacteria bacterium RIFCSPLOWO2_01_FULL_38_21]|nr:MAG: hypothetical protein A3B44_00280 [Candidatus Levybacteria bacterium RIFCSPLOWO2_01_FULL_38_21]